jgi:hypothetical protein
VVVRRSAFAQVVTFIGQEGTKLYRFGAPENVHEPFGSQAGIFGCGVARGRGDAVGGSAVRIHALQRV